MLHVNLKLQIFNYPKLYRLYLTCFINGNSKCFHSYLHISVRWMIWRHLDHKSTMSNVLSSFKLKHPYKQNQKSVTANFAWAGICGNIRQHLKGQKIWMSIFLWYNGQLNIKIKTKLQFMGMKNKFGLSGLCPFDYPSR